MASASAITTVESVADSEKLFFEDVEAYINSLNKKFREKKVITKSTLESIMKALGLEKGKSSNSFSPKFVYWSKQNFVVRKIAGIDVLCCITTNKPVCVYESFFNIIGECHTTVAHGGRDKTMAEITANYSWIPTPIVKIFLKHCSACQLRKTVKQPVVSKPIISLGVMTRLQIDLIDMRTRPDVVSVDVTYLWILNCVDHFSKFSWAYPLKSKSADEVARRLKELFFVFGPPRLLHSDNGTEFVATVIVELKQLFPEMTLVRGRPRHPQSQGCVERANGVLTSALGKWLSVNNSTNWSEGLLPVTYGINTRVSQTTKCTPYEVMFGQRPRSDSEFWKLVSEQNIQHEDQLPTPVEEDTDGEDVVVDVAINQSSSVVPIGTVHKLLNVSDENCLLDLSFTRPNDFHDIPTVDNLLLDDMLIDNLIWFDSPTLPPPTSSITSRMPTSPVFKLNFSPLIQSISPEVPVIKSVVENLLLDLDIFLDTPSSVVDNPMTSPSTTPSKCQELVSILIDSNIQLSLPPAFSTPFVAPPSSTNVAVSPSRHDLVRKRAETNYLNTANKKRKQYDEHLANLAEQYNVGDCVGLRIDSVDRTNTDAKLLPCLIISKVTKESDVVFRLVCQFGEIQNLYTVESLVDLKSSCPTQLKSVDFSKLDGITFTEACKLFVRGAISGKTCDCKGECNTKHCPCKKQGVFCSTKCHSRRGACKNMK
ncbi:unnamed protein product [Didymodactylos carnosus]|uniref:Integrase catalytic domain-containing protein n=1 Tax=Didymodactylos carnosus TaxID=1234261 RepID=A0A815YGG8_9BILA|nr:unnamed protein product [Didymodactylos carnosus]CAF1569474.1 unnamed protein product [Didymodactylos carnosus]CAF3594162.1 unnamed protein product [Didymodactylos carnosus]CAF4432465.1 unnamed protein product [Didymodactylos carnosus]